MRQLFLIGILTGITLALEAIFSQPQTQPVYNYVNNVPPVPMSAEGYPAPVYDPYPYPAPDPTAIEPTPLAPWDVLPTPAP